MSEEKTPLLTRISKELATLMDGHANREHVVLPFLHQLVAELPEEDRIEALEREVKELREQSDRFCDKYLAALKRAEAAEAREARLSEALRGSHDAFDTIKECAENCIHSPGQMTNYSTAQYGLKLIDAALSGSGSGWREPDGWKLVPVKPTDEMSYKAACQHYGKRRVDAAHGIDGISMTVDGADYNFRSAFKRFWEGALAASPAAPQQGGE